MSCVLQGARVCMCVGGAYVCEGCVCVCVCVCGVNKKLFEKNAESAEALTESDEGGGGR